MKTLKNNLFKVLKIKREIVFLHPLSDESRIRGIETKQNKPFCG